MNESEDDEMIAGFPDGLKVDMISTPGYGQVWVQGVELAQQDLKAAGIELRPAEGY